MPDLKKSIQGFVVASVLVAAMAPACAQDQVRIGIGFGLAFLPIYVCEDLKLVEKHAKEAHLDVKPGFKRFTSAAELHDALASGDIEIAPFGTAPLLAAWQQGKDGPGQVLAISGLSSMPLALLTNRADVQTLADLKPADRIAMPTLTSPQMYLLQLQSEKTFGQFDKLRGQVVALSHAEAMAALVEQGGDVTAYFSSPPFTQLALRDANVHAVLSSTDVMSGKSSFLMLGATRAAIEAQPQIADVVEKAIDEAARLISQNPRRAAQIYLTHEPSGTINGAAMEAVVKDIKDEFGSSIYGVQTIADFMSRHGDLRVAPRSWKEIVAPALLNSPSS